MKSIFRLSALSAATFLALGGLVGTAHAAGTAAGTAVNNIATLSYEVGGTPQSDLKSCVTTACTSTSGTPTSFDVDLKVNLTVAAQDATYVPIVSSGTAVVEFTVTNNSNATLDFNLALTPNKADGTYTGVFSGGSSVADTMDVSSCTMYVDTNGNGVYNAGTDTVATSIDNLAPDASQTVFAVCTAPALADEALGSIAAVGLTATALSEAGGALTHNGTVVISGKTLDVVFADGAGDNGDAANAGNHSDLSAYRIETANLTVLKSYALLCDPVNGVTAPKAIPGAIVAYSITITNDNSVALTRDLVKNALLTTVADPLADTLQFNTVYATPTDAASCVATAGANGTYASSAKIEVTAGTNTSGTLAHRTTAAAANIGLTLSTTADAGKDDLVTFSTANLAAALASGSTFAAGELPPGDSVTLTFQAVVE